MLIVFGIFVIIVGVLGVIKGPDVKTYQGDVVYKVVRENELSEKEREEYEKRVKGNDFR